MSAGMKGLEERCFVLSPDERFTLQTKFEARGIDECWPWLGSILPKGRRGVVWLRGRNHSAPRLMLAVVTGHMPPREVFACHTCDNPNCVNPKHLWWGSNSDNLKDASAKGLLPHATKEFCAKGHPLSGANLSIVKGNQRRCNRCTLDYKARRRKSRTEKGLSRD